MAPNVFSIFSLDVTIKIFVLNYIYKLSEKVWNVVLFPKRSIYSALRK